MTLSSLAAEIRQRFWLDRLSYGSIYELSSGSFDDLNNIAYTDSMYRKENPAGLLDGILLDY